MCEYSILLFVVCCCHSDFGDVFWSDRDGDVFYVNERTSLHFVSLVRSFVKENAGVLYFTSLAVPNLRLSPAKAVEAKVGSVSRKQEKICPDGQIFSWSG